MKTTIRNWIGTNWISTYQKIDDDILLLISIYKTGGNKIRPEFQFNIDLIVAQTLGGFSYNLLQGTHATYTESYRLIQYKAETINRLLPRRQVNFSYNDIKLLYLSALTKAVNYLWPQARSY